MMEQKGALTPGQLIERARTLRVPNADALEGKVLEFGSDDAILQLASPTQLNSAQLLRDSMGVGATPVPLYLQAEAILDIPRETGEEKELQEVTLGRMVSEGVKAMEKVRQEGANAHLLPLQALAGEAIILLERRPPIFVENNDFWQPPKGWEILGEKENADAIRHSLQSVGRINLVGEPRRQWVGTGFVIAPGKILTNRHVALEFCLPTTRSATSGSTIQEWEISGGVEASIDFLEEKDNPATKRFRLGRTVQIEFDKTCDMALLTVEEENENGEKLPDPLPLAEEMAEVGVTPRPVYVIGYPAWDGFRNDPQPMQKIFNNIFDVKRLQPGYFTGVDRNIPVLYHDCSTLGGNSGSPIIDLGTHRLLGLHFSGVFRETNCGVPLWLIRNHPFLK